MQGLARSVLWGTLSALFIQVVTPAQALGSTQKLFTSSVAYCSTPEVLYVQNAGLTFYRSNSTLEFELAAGSVADNVNVSIAAEVNAYGLGLINFNLDLCSIAGGMLCPLPTYQFNGAGVFPVPQDLLSEIPTIAYTVPDLEAVATLQLNNSQGQGVGCIQVTLSNGHTTQQSGAKWALVGVALLALFSSILHSVIAQSVGAAQWRIVDVMTSIQHIALTALLSLNYPVVYISYALNAAWSIGLVNIDSLQDSITSTRHKTGGTYSQPAFGDALTAERARTSNVLLGNTATDSSGSTPLALNLFKTDATIGSSSGGVSTSPQQHTLSAMSSHVKSTGMNLMKRATKYAPNTGPDGQPLQSRTNGNLPIVGNNGSSPYGGLDLFTQRAYVDPHNAFLTVLVSIMILIAIVVGALLVAYVIALLIRGVTAKSHGHVAHWSRRITRPTEFSPVVSATAGRTLLIIWPVFLVFAFYQWRYGDSWVPDFLAAIFLAFLLVAFSVFYLPLFKYARRGGKGSEEIYFVKDDPPLYGTKQAKRWGHMAHPYRPTFFWWSLAFALMAVIRACFISFAQGKDFTQAVGLLVFEVVFTVLLCVFRVGRDKKSDFVAITLGIFRVITWAVCVAFTRRANITTIPRVIVGFVLIVVTGLPIIWLFFLTLWDLFTPFLPSKRRNNQHLTHDEKEQLKNAKGIKSYGYGDVGAAEPASRTSSSEDGMDRETRPFSQDQTVSNVSSPANGSSDMHNQQQGRLPGQAI
ncbi:unnamed protein product [Sympodiomycopsis kandeliae]